MHSNKIPLAICLLKELTISYVIFSLSLMNWLSYLVEICARPGSAKRLQKSLMQKVAILTFDRDAREITDWIITLNQFVCFTCITLLPSLKHEEHCLRLPETHPVQNCSETSPQLSKATQKVEPPFSWKEKSVQFGVEAQKFRHSAMLK